MSKISLLILIFCTVCFPLFGQSPAHSSPPTDNTSKASVAPAWTPPNPPPAQKNWVWPTKDVTYRNVVITGFNTDDGTVTIIHSAGSICLPVSTLPADIQKTLNFSTTTGPNTSAGTSSTPSPATDTGQATFTSTPAEETQNSQTVSLKTNEGYSVELSALCDKYQLDKAVIMDLYGHPALTQADLCKKLGAFLDNEQQTSGTCFRFDDDPSSEPTGLVLENEEDFINKGIINADLYKITWNRMTGEETGSVKTGSFHITVKDIPFLLYCQNKCEDWGKAAKDNNLSDGVQKVIGTSDSGRIQATFITGGTSGAGGFVDLVIDSNRFYCNDPSVDGDSLLAWLEVTLNSRIEVARTTYSKQAQDQKDQEKAQEKTQADQNNVNNILK